MTFFSFKKETKKIKTYFQPNLSHINFSEISPAKRSLMESFIKTTTLPEFNQKEDFFFPFSSLFSTPKIYFFIFKKNYLPILFLIPGYSNTLELKKIFPNPTENFFILENNQVFLQNKKKIKIDDNIKISPLFFLEENKLIFIKAKVSQEKKGIIIQKYSF